MCLDVLSACSVEIEFNEQKCAEAVSDPLLLATDLADYFVMQGVPFRNAHHMVGSIVALSEKTGVPINELSDEAVFEICPQAKSDWRDVFDLKRAFEMRKGIGMPNLKLIAKQIENFKDLI
ncbi:MAG: argininosuccinate lyase, partial [Opitutales bacterium]|nr:argininosuccinate lyase [Opitutales bacterium]